MRATTHGRIEELKARLQARESWRRIAPRAAMVIAAMGLALLVRLPLLGFKSDDFYASLSAWYRTIRSMGFGAFATDFSTYNPPYLYLLYVLLRVAPDTPAVIGVKIPGLIGDFVCAFYVYRIVALTRSRPIVPIAAGAAALLAPSMVLNSAFWGQADSIYTAGLLACLYYLLTGKPGWSMVAFGMALAFKLQALFLAPFLLALFLRRSFGWKPMLVVPAILLLALVPSWFAGRPLAQLLNIYLYQSSQFEFITMQAPSIYAWLPQTKQMFNVFLNPGVLFGASMAFLLVSVIFLSPARLSKPLMLELALLSLMLVPFFLPKMHERYFFPADVLSIALAFITPQLFYVAILMNMLSFLAYEPFLFGREIVPLPMLAFVLLALISMLTYRTLRQLYAPNYGGPVPEIAEAAATEAVERIEPDGEAA